MKAQHQNSSENATVVDFRPAYDRIAELEHTHLEESVLAGIMEDAGATEEDLAPGMGFVAALLPTSAVFQHRSHRLIYACCLQLHSVGLKPNLQAVALRLASDDLLQEVGGRSKLSQLLDRDAFAVLNLKQNAEFLAEAWQRRRLADGLNDINKERDFDTALEKALKEIELTRQMRSPDATPLSAQSMRSLIIEIIERNLGEAELKEALNNLASDSRWNPKEVRELVELVETELDSEETRSERTAEIERIEEYKGRTLNLSRYLPSTIANSMQLVAEWLGVPSAALLLELLVGVASSAHPETRMVVKESIGFIEPLIIYGGLVTESGQRKSPTVNAVFDAIKQLQFEEEERFRLDSMEYEREQKEWNSTCPGKDSPSYQAWLDEQPTPPSPLREFYLDIATVEAIDKLKGQQPDTAFVLLKDELSGLFGSYGAYKNGKGEDREAILSGWNGRGRKKNLKGGERVSTLYDAMSIFGAIQDSKLQQMMGSFDDDQGDWGRFLWALIPLKALRLPESDTTFQLAFLKSLFERIRALEPQKYRFAFDAQRLYEDFHWKLEQRRVAHPQRGMRAAIAKMEGYCARLALALHIIWELEAGRVPAPYIPRERVQQAIRLTEFFLSQVTLIHSEGAAALGEGGLTPRLSAILGKLKQFGSLTAGKLQAAISWLRKVSPSKLRQDLMELAKLGYGTLVGQGNRLKLVWNQKTADTTDATADKTADSDDSLKPIDLREEQELNELTTDTTDTADIDSIDLHRQGYLSRDQGELPPTPACEALRNTGRAPHPNQEDLGAPIQVGYQEPDVLPPARELPSPLPLVDVPSCIGLSEQVRANNSSPYQQYQLLSSSPTDLDKSSVPAPDSVSVGESVDSSTGVSNPANNGDDPDDDPPGGSPVSPAYSPQRDNGGESVTPVSVTESGPATEPSGNSSGEMLTTEEMADWHSRLNACQTLDDAINSVTALDALSPEQRHQFESSVPKDTWAWLWSLPEAKEPEPESVPEFQELEPPEPESVPEQTLEQLKALLKACDSLVQLNELNRTHKKTIVLAYDSMSKSEQSHIDALAATAVPHRVFKYLGDSIRQGTERLIKGTLVYLAPATQVRASTYSVPVWAINGVSSGWKQPIQVSISLLQEVVKVVLPSQNYDSGHSQMGLI